MDWMTVRAFTTLKRRRIGSRDYRFGVRLKRNCGIGNMALMIGRVKVLAILSRQVSTLTDESTRLHYPASRKCDCTDVSIIALKN